MMSSRLLAILCCALLLNGCGGGGSSTAPEKPVKPVNPVDPADPDRVETDERLTRFKLPEVGTGFDGAVFAGVWVFETAVVFDHKRYQVDPAKRRFQIASNSPVFVDSSGNAKIDHKIPSISRKYRSFS